MITKLKSDLKRAFIHIHMKRGTLMSAQRLKEFERNVDLIIKAILYNNMEVTMSSKKYEELKQDFIIVYQKQYNLGENSDDNTKLFHISLNRIVDAIFCKQNSLKE